MFRFLLISICFISFQTCAQEESVKIQDFNKDGTLDTLKFYYDGGSSCGGKFAELYNGKTNDVYKLDTYGCFNQIKKIVLIPSELKKPENIAFLEAICKSILPEKKIKPDASLEWIINSTFKHKKSIENTYFDRIIDPQNPWNKGKIILPGTYYITIKDEFIIKFYNTRGEAPAILKESGNTGYLIYYGHNHYKYLAEDSLNLIDTFENYKVYKTTHGVLVQKENFFKWVFISDAELTGSPEKLRWESIIDVTVKGNYIIIQQNIFLDNEYNLYVVNIETGICGRLNINIIDELTNRYKEIGNYNIDDNNINIIIGGEEIQFKLDTVFQELEKLYITN